MDSLVKMFNQFVLEEAREVRCEMVYSEYYKKWMALNYGSTEYDLPGVRMMNSAEDIVDELLTCIAFHTLVLPGFKDASVVEQIGMVKAYLEHWIPKVASYMTVTEADVNRLCNTIFNSLYR